MGVLKDPVSDETIGLKTLTLCLDLLILARDSLVMVIFVFRLSLVGSVYQFPSLSGPTY